MPFREPARVSPKYVGFVVLGVSACFDGQSGFPLGAIIFAGAVLRVFARVEGAEKKRRMIV